MLHKELLGLLGGPCCTAISSEQHSRLLLHDEVARLGQLVLSSCHTTGTSLAECARINPFVATVYLLSHFAPLARHIVLVYGCRAVRVPGCHCFLY